MVVDPSAIVAVLKKESDAPEYARHLATPVAKVMTTAAYVESCIAADNPKNAFDRAALDWLLAISKIAVVAVTPAQAARAADAHTRYGRWSGSPAKLNFGDCFSYALAIEQDEALLYKGNGFGHTDVKKVL